MEKEQNFVQNAAAHLPELIDKEHIAMEVDDEMIFINAAFIVYLQITLFYYLLDCWVGTFTRRSPRPQCFSGKHPKE